MPLIVAPSPRRIFAGLGLIGGALAITTGFALAQMHTSVRPEFEVASIRPCKDENGGGRGMGRGSSRGAASVGMLNLNCRTVMDLIQTAYARFANGVLSNSRPASIEGGAGWVASERYSIEAKAEGPQDQSTMNGPMLQALLEDRFHLKIHRETKDVPAYALTVASKGPKLHPFKEGSCVPLPFGQLPRPPLEPGQEYCQQGVMSRLRGPNMTSDMRAASLDEFCRTFFVDMDRPVVDKTGITGLFDFHLVYAADPNSELVQGAARAAASGLEGLRVQILGGAEHLDDPPEASIFSAIEQQLGLRLERTRAPGEFLVIDHVERPSEN